MAWTSNTPWAVNSAAWARPLPFLEATDTPMMRATVPGKASPQALRQQYALKRLGTVLEQAQAILFLTSAESSFVTGVALSVDIGRTFH